MLLAGKTVVVGLFAFGARFCVMACLQESSVKVKGRRSKIHRLMVARSIPQVSLQIFIFYSNPSMKNLRLDLFGSKKKISSCQVISSSHLLSSNRSRSPFAYFVVCKYKNLQSSCPMRPCNTGAYLRTDQAYDGSFAVKMDSRIASRRLPVAMVKLILYLRRHADLLKGPWVLFIWIHPLGYLRASVAHQRLSKYKGRPAF
jgi:hypothetical protein